LRTDDSQYGVRISFAIGFGPKLDIALCRDLGEREAGVRVPAKLLSAVSKDISVFDLVKALDANGYRAGFMIEYQRSIPLREVININ